MTPQNVMDKIVKFSKKMEGEALEILPCVPCDGAKSGFCYENVNLKLQNSGGLMQVGWMFHHRVVAINVFVFS